MDTDLLDVHSKSPNPQRASPAGLVNIAPVGPMHFAGGLRLDNESQPSDIAGKQQTHPPSNLEVWIHEGCGNLLKS